MNDTQIVMAEPNFPERGTFTLTDLYKIISIQKNLEFLLFSREVQHKHARSTEYEDLCITANVDGLTAVIERLKLCETGDILESRNWLDIKAFSPQIFSSAEELRQLQALAGTSQLREIVRRSETDPTDSADLHANSDESPEESTTRSSLQYTVNAVLEDGTDVATKIEPDYSITQQDESHTPRNSNKNYNSQNINLPRHEDAGNTTSTPATQNFHVWPDQSSTHNNYGFGGAHARPGFVPQTRCPGSNAVRSQSFPTSITICDCQSCIGRHFVPCDFVRNQHRINSYYYRHSYPTPMTTYGDIDRGGSFYGLGSTHYPPHAHPYVHNIHGLTAGENLYVGGYERRGDYINPRNKSGSSTRHLDDRKHKSGRMRVDDLSNAHNEIEQLQCQYPEYEHYRRFSNEPIPHNDNLQPPFQIFPLPASSSPHVSETMRAERPGHLSVHDLSVYPTQQRPIKPAYQYVQNTTQSDELRELTGRSMRYQMRGEKRAREMVDDLTEKQAIARKRRVLSNP